MQACGHLWVRVQHELKAFVRGLGGHHLGDLLEHLREEEISGVHLQLAGLDLGEVEDVVEDAQQILRGLVDLFHVLALLGLQVGHQGQVGQADDGVHGGADLVAHVGQEAALGLVGRLCGFLGQGQALHGQIQIPGALGHQVFQAVAVLLELLLVLVALGDIDVAATNERTVQGGQADQAALAAPAAAVQGEDVALEHGFFAAPGELQDPFPTGQYG